MTVHIFISYSQEDFKPDARFLCNYLSKHLADSDIFIDQLKPKGSQWQVENDQKLHESDIVVVILTNSALTSPEVKREIEIAKSDPNRVIIPCKDDLLKMEWPIIPYSLNVFDGLEFEKKEELGRKLVGEIRAGRTYPLSIESNHEINPVRILGVPNTNFNLNYNITNGNVLSARIDRDALSLIIDVVTFDNGSIKIILPKKLIDAKVGEQDDELFVLANRNEISFEQDVNDKERILNIKFVHPLEQLEIIGTEILGMSFVGSLNQTNVIEILEGARAPRDGPYLSYDVLIIKTGEKVRWHNASGAATTITSCTPENIPDGHFDSSLLMPQQDFEVTFAISGVYEYFSLVHPWIIGTIVVD